MSFLSTTLEYEVRTEYTPESGKRIRVAPVNAGSTQPQSRQVR